MREIKYFEAIDGMVFNNEAGCIKREEVLNHFKNGDIVLYDDCDELISFYILLTFLREMTKLSSSGKIDFLDFYDLQINTVIVKNEEGVKALQDFEEMYFEEIYGGSIFCEIDSPGKWEIDGSVEEWAFCKIPEPKEKIKELLTEVFELAEKEKLELHFCGYTLLSSDSIDII